MPIEHLSADRPLRAEASLAARGEPIATALLETDRFPEAIAQARLSIAEYPPESGPNAETPWLALIAAESANGQDAEAHADPQKFLATPRAFRTMAQIQKFAYYVASPKLPEGLRRAGMPAEQQRQPAVQSGTRPTRVKELYLGANVLPSVRFGSRVSDRLRVAPEGCAGTRRNLRASRKV